jgi:uncharacterized membrane protein
MSIAHLINIAVHIGTGSIAMAIGCYVLATAKGTATHRRAGRIFAGFTLLVCASAVLGNVFFRFMPLFAVLTVLVLYQLLSGWHVAYTKGDGPNRVDALLCASAIIGGAALAPHVLAGGGSGASVIYASLGALFVLVVYDTLRWLFPRRWHATLWRYEHSYKLLASLFAMLSAALGNLFPQGQPWSQLGPSAAGIVCIGWFFWREARACRRLAPTTAAASQAA